VSALTVIHEVVPSPAELEDIAVSVARAAATQVAASFGSAAAIATKSSDTDVVTQTDLDTETLIRRLLEEATPGCGFVGEEGGGTGADRRLQWIIDPLDGTVNFLYAVPIFSVSIAAAVDGEFVAGAVVDAMRAEVFSAHVGGGARCDGVRINASNCVSLPLALIGTGFSYTPRLRAIQGDIISRMLPIVRDIRCFGSAALNLCWVAMGRTDGYFERDIKVWDWAAGAIIAAEAGAEVEFPCPENDGLVMAAGRGIVESLRTATLANPEDSLSP
jgi:myo-inositol-1(or 4)-monophosphatase